VDVDPVNITSNISSWYNIGWMAGSAIAGVCAYFWGRRKGVESDLKNADITPKFQQKQNIIYDQVLALRILTGADRSKIGQFHNGGKFLDGSSMKRFSITHESCDLGVPFEGTNLQNIVVTIFWDMISLIKSEKPEVVFAKDLPEGHFRSYCRSHGVDAVLLLPIRKDELYTGFVMLEWCDVDKIPQDLNKVKDIAEHHRASIEVEMLLRR